MLVQNGSDPNGAGHESRNQPDSGQRGDQLMAFVKRVERKKPWLAVYQDGDGREHSKAFLRKGDAERFLVVQAERRPRGDVGGSPAGADDGGRRWGERFLAARAFDAVARTGRVVVPQPHRRPSRRPPVGVVEPRSGCGSGSRCCPAKGLAAHHRGQGPPGPLADPGRRGGGGLHRAVNPVEKVKPPPVERQRGAVPHPRPRWRRWPDAIEERWPGHGPVGCLLRVAFR